MSSHEAQQGSSLLERTRELLRGSKQSYNGIFLATGLTPHWLSCLATGRLKDPSVNKVQTLYEHLSGKKLIGQKLAV